MLFVKLLLDLQIVVILFILSFLEVKGFCKGSSEAVTSANVQGAPRDGESIIYFSVHQLKFKGSNPTDVKALFLALILFLI